MTMIVEGGMRQKNAGADNGSGTFRPLVTIISVVFNDVKLLEETIKSVVGQSSRDFEYIVLDGGSTDETLDVLRGYSQVVDFWRSEPDDGIYDAFNKGVRLARGEWILFLGAGDLLIDDHAIEAIESGLRSASPDVMAAYGRVVRLNANGQAVYEENQAWTEMQNQWSGGRQTMPQHQGIFERRRFLIEHPFDTKYSIVADYKSFSMAIAQHPPLYLDCVISQVGIGGVSTAPRKSVAACFEIIRLNRELGRGSDHLWHQLFFLLKSVVKTLLSIALPLRGTKRVIDAYRRLTKRPSIWT